MKTVDLIITIGFLALLAGIVIGLVFAHISFMREMRDWHKEMDIKKPNAPRKQKGGHDND